ncbi:MAG TPA: hypothetical protein PLH11_12830, partial [Gemmobacter sp.]|nr:hypothetical protein [Gemmobacter sp.]
MQASNRRNDQTAHISLQISINVKEHGNTLSGTDRSACPLAHFRNSLGVSGSSTCPASASRRSRFGEVASRPVRQKPQGQKSGNLRKIHKTFAEPLVSLT